MGLRTDQLPWRLFVRQKATEFRSFKTVFSFAFLCTCVGRHPPDAPEKAISLPVGFRVETPFCAATQEFDGGSHGGGGLWEGGGTIQGESALRISSFRKTALQ